MNKPQSLICALSVFWLLIKMALVLLLVRDEVARVVYQNF
jgi:hypothetical protein